MFHTTESLALARCRLATAEAAFARAKEELLEASSYLLAAENSVVTPKINVAAPSEGHVYVIICARDHRAYIGRTTQTVKARYGCHISTIKSGLQSVPRLAAHMEQYGFQNFRYETLATVPLSYLLAAEKHYVETFLPELNVEHMPFGILNETDDSNLVRERRNSNMMKYQLCLESLKPSVPKGVRSRVKWSDMEVQALKKGMQTHGSQSNKWCAILNSSQGTFHPSRTGVDLKDKWRNLAKTLHIQTP